MYVGPLLPFLKFPFWELLLFYRKFPIREHAKTTGTSFRGGGHFVRHQNIQKFLYRRKAAERKHHEFYEQF